MNLRKDWTSHLFPGVGHSAALVTFTGVVNGRSDMVGRTWDHVCGMTVMVMCPGDLGGGVCTWLCVYVFGSVQIVVYNVGDVICVW